MADMFVSHAFSRLYYQVTFDLLGLRPDKMLGRHHTHQAGFESNQCTLALLVITSTNVHSGTNAVKECWRRAIHIWTLGRVSLFPKLPSIHSNIFQTRRAFTRMPFWSRRCRCSLSSYAMKYHPLQGYRMGYLLRQVMIKDLLVTGAFVHVVL